jgi:hypothetical protein
MASQIKKREGAMKRTILAALIMLITLALTGCGDGGSSPPPTFVTQIFSNPALDGDIVQELTGARTVTQGMTLSPLVVQSVFAGIDPADGAEFRAFLDFPLTGAGGVPSNAIIVSAFLDIFIKDIQPRAGTIPILIELVSFQPPTLLVSDFDRAILRPLATITTQVFQTDFRQHVLVDVTPLMAEAQSLGLVNFQIRILGLVSPGLIEIDDTTTTLADRDLFAPLLTVTYF